MTARRCRLRPTLVGATALAVAACAATTTAPARAADEVSVFDRPVTSALPTDFLGLAIENNTVPRWIATGGQAPDVALQGLVKNLEPSGRASIRIGGQSTDRSWWPVAHVAKPIGVTASLGPSWTSAARALAQGTNSTLILGLNLEAGSTAVARTEADQFVGRIGRQHIAALQIGNEPDLYLHTPWYRVQGQTKLPWYSHSGTPVYSRSFTWNAGTFAAQFSQIARALPPLPLAGPESGYAPWIRDFAGRFMTRHSRVRTLTTHAYGLNNCVHDVSSPDFPTVANMLTTHASRTLLDGVADEVGVAHRAGARFRVDEMGSVTCNGHAGVSNTFASALWAMDALFSLARSGVDGVNLHTYPDSLNGLFDIAYDTHAKQWRATVHPLYDGVLMFARAAPAGSRLLRIATPDQSTVRAWATIGADRQVRVLLVNDSTTAASTVRVHAPAGYGSAPATVQRLLAPSAGATGSITLGGHPFSQTTTGIPRDPVSAPVTPARGVFTVRVPAHSAALLTAATAAAK